jgi:peroxiredoxin
MKYNKILLSITIFAIVGVFALNETQAQKKKVILKGIVTQYNPSDTIELYDALGRIKEPLERTTVDKKGLFELTYNPDEINFYTVKISNARPTFIVMSPNTPIEIVFDTKQGIITETKGSKENELLKQFYIKMTSASAKKDSLLTVYKANPDPQVQLQLQMLDAEWGNYLRNLCLKNTSNFSSAFLIENLPQEKFFDVHDTVLSDLIKKYPQHFFIKAKYEEMASHKKTAVGAIAPEIELPDTNGNIIKLSSLRGKIVLIDFWASWCGPCRKESPNMVNLYQTYHDKGFEIYGVSLDQSKANWIGAIISDSLSWIHVSDLKRWQCQAGLDYGIRSIPSTILIDEEGRIIAKNLRGEKLANKVKEVIESKK